MNEELKTLKDLKHIEFEFINDNDLVGMEVISIDKLRAEAVKWFKHKGFRFEDGWECFRMFLNLPEELTDDNDEEDLKDE